MAIYYTYIAMADNVTVGGWSGTKPANEHVQLVADKVT